MSPQIPQDPVLHRSQWIVPVLSPPVRDGAVLVHNGRIRAAGPFSTLKREVPIRTKILDHGRAAIMPALVNVHTHLDLSALKGSIDFPRKGFPDWITAFFPLRAELGPDAVADGVRAGRRELFETGTALYGDITNGASLGFSGTGGLPERLTFLELIGFNCESVAAAMPVGIKSEISGKSFSTVPHSAYSASPAVIAGAKDHTRARGLPFSIHTAEHPEEIEFLRGGTGFCRELLERLGRWDPQWRAPLKSPVQYLDSLGALDRLTLLVHAVHLDDADRALAAERKCSICFCPRSNRNLNVGRPEIEKTLSFGIPTCLGTDSLASNTDLDLFAEAAFVLDEYPGIRPEAVIAMITATPARVLGRGADFGTVEPGLKADLLVISLDSTPKESHLAEALVRYGEKGEWKWVNTPEKS